mgnify:FL=1
MWVGGGGETPRHAMRSNDSFFNKPTTNTMINSGPQLCFISFLNGLPKDCVYLLDTRPSVLSKKSLVNRRLLSSTRALQIRRREEGLKHVNSLSLHGRSRVGERERERENAREGKKRGDGGG